MNQIKAFFILLLFTSMISLETGHAQEADQPTQSMTLNEAVETALDLNRELGAVRSERNAARYGVWESRSSYLPQIFFNSDSSHTYSDQFSTGGSANVPPGFEDIFDPADIGLDGTTFRNSFNFTQLIFDRSVIGNITLSKLQEAAAIWQATGQEQAVVFDTVGSYLDVLRAREQLQIQTQRLDLADEQLDTAQSNFDVGLRIRTDVLRAELTRSSAMRDVVSAEIAEKQAQVIFNEIIGIPLESRFNYTADDLAMFNPSGEILAWLEKYPLLAAYAEFNNPAIKVASILVDQRLESIDIAKGEFYPQLSVSGRAGWYDTRSLDFQYEEWAITGTISVPIFEGGRKLAKIRRSNELLDAGIQRYENTIRGVVNTVEQAALSLQEGHRNLQIALEAEKVAEENHERFLSLYQEGLADSLDLTQALTELVEAQTNVVTSRYGYMRLYAQLLFALGAIPTESEDFQTVRWLQIIQDTAASELESIQQAKTMVQDK